MTKKNHAYWIREEIKNIKVEERFLPEECANRTLVIQIPLYIVIHEVSLGLGRSPHNYDMQHYADKIRNDGYNDIKVGYHYLVGDKEIYQFIPDNECANHTGTKLNSCSIGIERLICEGIRYSDALHNQAKLAATLMVKWNIPISRVISHKSSKIMSEEPIKQCPARLIQGQYGGFESFYREIHKCLKDRDLFYDLLVDNYSYEEHKELIDRKL